jgi:hypothetical protein
VVGTHEGTHVINDIFDAMDNLGIDRIKVKGKAAKKLFNAIKDYMNTAKGANTREEKPNENEKKSRKELNN